MLKDLGKQIRRIRKEKNLTLVEISEQTGIAQATLSRIETGTMIGTIESHEKIAEILGIGLSDLYAEIDNRAEKTAHQKSSEAKVTFQNKNVQTRLLTQQATEKKITPLLVTLSPQSKTSVETLDRGVEKFLWVTSGAVKVKIGTDDYILAEGETLYFDASLPHEISNTENETSTIFCAVSPSKI